MASGTLIFRPSADVSVNHARSSGSTGYSLIADINADDNSTYISQTLSSTSSTSMSSTFTLTSADGLPPYSYKITAVRLYSRAMGASNNGSGSYACYFAAGTAAGGSSNNAATSGNTTSSYTTLSSESSELLTTINNELELTQEFPVISVKVTTKGTKSSDKNANNGYIRVTQVYAEFDYEETVFQPPEEEEGVNYYSLTISSINATTTPNNGTTRLQEGSNQIITITPTNPLLTLATDNGVDITSQLTRTEVSNTYNVTTQVSGANYGFPLNSNTNYYTSNNKAQANSAAVARINFDLDSDCVVTIQYINYAEATYDYGIFGKLDTALTTTSTSDSNAQYICNTNNDNTNTAKTITYNVPAGSHFIDIKYRKDNATDSNNDTLQWRISNFETTGGDAIYTYNLANITEKHSLMFIFGQVTYYTIISSGDNCKIFPDGQVIVMPGDSYTINIAPNAVTDTVGISDNGTNMTNNLHKDKGLDKDGLTIASYSYELTNIQENHTLDIVSVAATSILYEKVNDKWLVVTDAYYKENGHWVKKDLSFFSDLDLTYMKKG